MPESNRTFSTLYVPPVVTTHKWFRIMTPVISGFLVLAGVLLALSVLWFRYHQLDDLPADTLLGALGVLLVTAGIAVSALANGLLTRVMLETARLDQETLSQQATNLHNS